MTTEALVPAAAEPAAVTSGGGEIVLPQVIVDAGPSAVARFLEFFAGRIANATRAAYGRAVGQFLGWCEARGLGLRDVPAHHRAAAALDAYVEAGGLEEPKAALFQTVDPPGRQLTGRALERRVVLAMIKRRAAAAGLPPSTCCHTFRATGITAYLSNGGTLEHAQQIAGHASPKTTTLYDRTADTVTVDEIERIVISGVSLAFDISVSSCTMTPPNGLDRQLSRRVREPRTDCVELGCT